jgi:hypothetical protein
MTDWDITEPRDQIGSFSSRLEIDARTMALGKTTMEVLFEGWEIIFGRWSSHDLVLRELRLLRHRS